MATDIAIYLIATGTLVMIAYSVYPWLKRWSNRVPAFLNNVIEVVEYTGTLTIILFLLWLIMFPYHYLEMMYGLMRGKEVKIQWPGFIFIRTPILLIYVGVWIFIVLWLADIFNWMAV